MLENSERNEVQQHVATTMSLPPLWFSFCKQFSFLFSFSFTNISLLLSRNNVKQPSRVEAAADRPSEQWRPFQPCLHTHDPLLQYPWAEHRRSHSRRSHVEPVQPFSQIHRWRSHLPCTHSTVHSSVHHSTLSHWCNDACYNSVLLNGETEQQSTYLRDND